MLPTCCRIAYACIAPRAMSTASRASSFLIIPSQVEDILSKDEKAVILDATWFMPGVKRDPEEEFVQKHLPRAQRWDVDKVASKHELNLPHMLPDAETFAIAAGKAGITRDTTVIVYDGHGLLSAPRTLFTFKAFQHERVFALNGGLPRWLAEGKEVESGPAIPVVEANYEMDGSFDPNRDIRSYEDIVESSQSGEDLIFDSRPGPRFHGTAPEPRPWLESGHMPNSVSVPFPTLLTPASDEPGSYQTLLPEAELRRVFTEAAGGAEGFAKILSGEKQVITSCGSGMTASVVWLALQTLGAKNVALYDESWMGYASRKESKIEKTAQ